MPWLSTFEPSSWSSIKGKSDHCINYILCKIDTRKCQSSHKYSLPIYSFHSNRPPAWDKAMCSIAMLQICECRWKPQRREGLRRRCDAIWIGAVVTCFMSLRVPKIQEYSFQYLSKQITNRSIRSKKLLTYWEGPRPGIKPENCHNTVK